MSVGRLSSALPKVRDVRGGGKIGKVSETSRAWAIGRETANDKTHPLSNRKMTWGGTSGPQRQKGERGHLSEEREGGEVIKGRETFQWKRAVNKAPRCNNRRIARTNPPKEPRGAKKNLRIKAPLVICEAEEELKLLPSFSKRAETGELERPKRGALDNCHLKGKIWTTEAKKDNGRTSWIGGKRGT